MPDLSITRHQSVFDPSSIAHIPIHIIGCGATGSRLWLSLVELGLTNIIAWDFDSIEPHNLANQIFIKQQVGMPKVDALADYYQMKTGETPPEEMQFRNEKVTSDTDLSLFKGVVFLLTDTMDSRREIFDLIIQNDKLAAVIETRMASSFGDVFCINPCDEEQVEGWKRSLIDDDQAEVSACGASISVGATASILANLAVWQMVNLFNEGQEPEEHIGFHLAPWMPCFTDVRKIPEPEPKQPDLSDAEVALGNGLWDGAQELRTGNYGVNMIRPGPPPAPDHTADAVRYAAQYEARAERAAERAAGRPAQNTHQNAIDAATRAVLAN